MPWLVSVYSPCIHSSLESTKRMCLFCCLSSLFFSLSPSALPKFSLSLHLCFSLLFFLPVQEMAHILAQKQLRSIILSVSLTMPFSSTHPPLPSVSPCLSVFVSLYLWSGLCLCTRVISERKMTPATSACRWSLVIIYCTYFRTPVPIFSLSCSPAC